MDGTVSVIHRFKSGVKRGKEIPLEGTDLEGSENGKKRHTLKRILLPDYKPRNRLLKYTFDLERKPSTDSERKVYPEYPAVHLTNPA